MNPFLSKELASEHIRDLHEAARGNRGRKNRKPSHDTTARITVRRFARFQVGNEIVPEASGD